MNDRSCQYFLFSLRIMSGAILCCVMLLAVSLPSFGQEMSRAELIAFKLDCYSRAPSFPGINWDDVCATPGSAQEEAQDMPDAQGEEQSDLDEEEYYDPDFDLESHEVAPRGWFKEGQDLEETPAGSLTDNDPLRDIEINNSIAFYKLDQADNGLVLEAPYYNLQGGYTVRRFENEPVESLRDLFSEKSSLNMFGLEARLGYGYLYYDRAAGGTANYVQDLTVEGRLLSGYDFPLQNKKLLTIYGGIGYRFNRTDFGGRAASGGGGTYDWDTTFQYIPIGANLDIPLKGRWRIGLKAEFDFLVYGLFKAQFKDRGDLDDAKMDLNDGYGLKAAVRLVRKNPAPPDFFVEPFIDFWDIQNSEKSKVRRINLADGQPFDDYLDIPDFDIIEWGIKFGFVY